MKERTQGKEKIQSSTVLQSNFYRYNSIRQTLPKQEVINSIISQYGFGQSELHHHIQKYMHPDNQASEN